VTKLKNADMMACWDICCDITELLHSITEHNTKYEHIFG